MTQWHQIVYNNGVAMDQHNAVTMDRALSHQHAADLRYQQPCPLVNEPALLLINDIKLLLFSCCVVEILTSHIMWYDVTCPRLDYMTISYCKMSCLTHPHMHKVLFVASHATI